MLLACLLVLSGCGESGGDVNPEKGKNDREKSDVQLDHAGNDPCENSDGSNQIDCEKHCGQFKIVVEDNFPCKTPFPVHVDWDDCGIGSCEDDFITCYRAEKKSDSAKGEWFPTDICRCCDQNDDGDEELECPQHNLTSHTFMTKVKQNNEVYAEYPNKKLYSDACDCDPNTTTTCCSNGYYARYDTSTKLITLGCL